MQLVAIKRLQAQGRSLVEIQATLMGVGDSTLAKWSALPEGFSETIESQIGRSDQAASEPTQAGRENFWTATPNAKAYVARKNHQRSAAATTAVHLKVTDNVTLVIEGVEADAMDARTLAELKPLLESLKRVLDQNGSTSERESRNKKEPTEETKPANDNEGEQP
jgi:hypothetical protein